MLHLTEATQLQCAWEMEAYTHDLHALKPILCLLLSETKMTGLSNLASQIRALCPLTMCCITGAALSHDLILLSTLQECCRGAVPRSEVSVHPKDTLKSNKNTVHRLKS